MGKNIHFIGIGGIGTSNLAQILHEKGIKISGSDLVPSQITKGLKLKGIKVDYGHSEKNISRKHDLIIYSPAIPADNPELKKAKKLKIRCVTYPDALAMFSNDHLTIAVTGTHGKSTTTAMLAAIFVKAKMDPTVAIGTKVRELGNKNYRAGGGNHLIMEACEYKESFLKFTPHVLVLTNIEAEHLDHYKTFENYKKAFEKAVSKVPRNGKIIVNAKDKGLMKIVKKAKTEVIPVRPDKDLKVGIPGEFNRENAALATETAKIFNINPETIKKALKDYKGSWRRMQYKRKKLDKTVFIDDYAHHPTEIKMTLAAIKENHPDSKLLCVFQPHQYSRTKILLKEFGKSFIDADKVIIPNIYRVRDTEEDVKKVSADALVKEIDKNSQSRKALDGGGIKNTAQYIKDHHKNFDIIVTMGAGDVNKIYNYL